ncbi:MAG: hypothetical protein P4M13_11320 [Alphaproteobacteria bacterium]|nr:hypothetical protein [Alphaproteobacteria bacterium]
MKKLDDKAAEAARRQLQSQGRDAKRVDGERYQVIDERSGERRGRPLTRAELIDLADGHGSVDDD